MGKKLVVCFLAILIVGLSLSGYLNLQKPLHSSDKFIYAQRLNPISTPRASNKELNVAVLCTKNPNNVISSEDAMLPLSCENENSTLTCENENSTSEYCTNGLQNDTVEDFNIPEIESTYFTEDESVDDSVKNSISCQIENFIRTVFFSFGQLSTEYDKRMHQNMAFSEFTFEFDCIIGKIHDFIQDSEENLSNLMNHFKVHRQNLKFTEIAMRHSKSILRLESHIQIPSLLYDLHRYRRFVAYQVKKWRISEIQKEFGHLKIKDIDSKIIIEFINFMKLTLKYFAYVNNEDLSQKLKNGIKQRIRLSEKLLKMKKTTRNGNVLSLFFNDGMNRTLGERIVNFNNLGFDMLNRQSYLSFLQVKKKLFFNYKENAEFCSFVKLRQNFMESIQLLMAELCQYTPSESD